MRVLLHACCAPCASTAVERLLGVGHAVTLFFSNHNIDTPAEHALRLLHVERLAAHFNAPLLVDAPDRDTWRAAVAGHENVPERGSRCALCFRYSLSRACGQMRQAGFDAFTTSLTTSPHKSSPVIFAIGRELAEDRFLAMDFKKDDGFGRARVLSSALGLYRQNYCGCSFSRSRPDQTPLSNSNFGDGTIGVGVGIGIGIDKTNGNSTPIPIPTPTPITQSPHN
jgi:predicted adenine nucleotide alpha hydrolase (AANH) superfamily ATPase